jgi:hypothetical protein
LGRANIIQEHSVLLRSTEHGHQIIVRKTGPIQRTLDVEVGDIRGGYGGVDVWCSIGGGKAGRPDRNDYWC